ncbi:MAG: serine--tRNA ligase [Candidatus Krumholzibacteria bacterium]|jgi:seryl-tRNA synthetase|nr:serine--tRNA ligase [Candidatus Krumholzibacteria bacterium]MDP6669732.1 serine--tRNA ligase [Candidatus Krumholzibacteria bacterium]MDP6798056.1 serine--tRNA ligase [Candidatus Krumholzibacteria bacterium]MDP7022490.1 serine--tRNA ligase [Candidatus Krumholzibacteria bacterium]
MLDRKFIRMNPEDVRKAIADKRESAELDRFLELDARHLDILRKAEDLKGERNRASEEINRMKKSGEDCTEAITKTRELSRETKELDAQRAALEEELLEVHLTIPNMPHESVPRGGEEDNELVRSWGEIPGEGEFERKPHWEIGEELGVLDIERGSKVAGSGFPVLMGGGARLERALINFMLDLHRENGFLEVCPPLMVNDDAARGTGQLPKSADQMYRTAIEGLWLIPTSEVPLTNLYANEILDGDRLPIALQAFTPCFRREAGAHGKDTRGLLRVHQFDKVEMVKFVEPETSFEELESLVNEAEKVLQALEIPYRVLTLASGDLSFAASKCYDLEIWSPGVKRWLEVSSVSNFTDFQARRANIRYRPAKGEKPAFLHTLNGSGVALARLMACLLETGQRADGRVNIPEALRPWMGGLEFLEREEVFP